MRGFILCVVLLLGAVRPALAQQYQPALHLIWETSHLRETGAALTAPQVIRMQDSFQPGIPPDKNARAFWLRLTIHVTDEKMGKFILVLNDNAQAELYNSEGRFISQAGRNISTRSNSHGYFSEYLGGMELNKQVSVWYVKVHPPYITDFRISFLKRGTWDQRHLDSFIPDIICISILLAIALYNFFLFLIVRDRSFIYYVLYLFFIPLLLVSKYAFYDTPFTPAQLVFAVDFSLALALYFYLKFFNAFFNIEAIISGTKTFTRIYAALIVVVLLALTFHLIDQPQTFNPPEEHLLAFLGLAGMVYSVVNMIRLAYRKHPLILYFAIASSPMLLFATVYILHYIVIRTTNMQFDFNPAMWYKFSAVAESVLLALCLAARMNQLDKALVKQELANEQLELKKLIEIQQITEDKQGELEEQVQKRTQELNHLNETKDKLFAILSHDLRSPLQSLIALLRMKKMAALTPEEMDAHLDRMWYQILSLSSTLDNTLHWSRSQMRGFQTAPASLGLRQVISETATLLKERLIHKRIAVSISVDHALKVYADRDQVLVVLRNLIGNAIKFSPSESTIRISAKEIPGFIEIYIEDEGTGISEARREQLFTDQATSSPGTLGEKGTGLGLLFAKEMIENNGGTIRVEPAAKQGAVFIFTLIPD